MSSFLLSVLATGKKKINLSLSQLVKHLTTSADNKLSFDRMLVLEKKSPQKYIHVYNIQIQLIQMHKSIIHGPC